MSRIVTVCRSSFRTPFVLGSAAAIAHQVEQLPGRFRDPLERPHALIGSRYMDKGEAIRELLTSPAKKS